MNTLRDFPRDQYRFLAVCESCNRMVRLDRDKLSDDMTIPALRERVTCQECGSQDCGIRIVYVGAGEYRCG